MNNLKILPFLIATLCFGCQESSEYGICSDVCQELYQQCEYAAFPSYESCIEGCAYNEEEGADMEDQLECFQDAECNTFEIIECENEHGAKSDD